MVDVSWFRKTHPASHMSTIYLQPETQNIHQIKTVSQLSKNKSSVMNLLTEMGQVEQEFWLLLIYIWTL